MKLKLALASSFLASALTLGTALACDGKDAQKNAQAAEQTTNEVANASLNLKVDGMHCEGCVTKIKTALAKVEGVVTVDIKLADKVVFVKYNKDKVSSAKIAKVISELGFKANAEA